MAEKHDFSKMFLNAEIKPIPNRQVDLLPCPFCGSTDIRYSLKITGHFDVRYHASMYCNKCHCYGARTLTESVSHNDYKGRHYIEQDETIKQKAIERWNTRTPKERGGEK